ncbi:sensor histidine kinase [Sabulicella rubraurantiaca]|uniref:sensor histidine kinase n=1 Tax=Sabulicella rubraurantiaca TaxID=2811429 RepID=UPI001A972CCD|nr:histidine kinase dimerization/phosphoacceptor domain -containing protein [Sabulicella rubraurantiaca]
MTRFLAGLALAPRGPLFRWGVALLAFLVAFGARVALDSLLPSGFPFLTFFPAVIIVAFLCGARAGTAVAVASLIASHYFFLAPIGSFELNLSGALALGFFALIASVDIALIRAMTHSLRSVREERERNRRLAESRETLYRELQHRISNNLQMVSSLLAVESRAVTDDRAQHVLQDARRRLDLISRLHRQLHDPEATEIRMDEFLRELCEDNLAAAGVSDRVRHVLRAAPIALSPARAIPVGLVAAEFIANAVEHGFPDGREGSLVVALADEGQGVAALSVEDDGAGLPDGFNLRGSNSLGLQIVRQLADQLGGEFQLSGTHGAVARLRFPVREG